MTRKVEVRLKLDRTPTVRKSALRDALSLAREVSLAKPDDFDAFAAALAERFGTGDVPTALWARTRALLAWQSLDSTRESDRLMHDDLALQAGLGLCDARILLALEVVARVHAAAKHPLDSDGHFEEGFPAAIEAAKLAELRKTRKLWDDTYGAGATANTPAGVTVN